jgi:hypothetical protein
MKRGDLAALHLKANGPKPKGTGSLRGGDIHPANNPSSQQINASVPLKVWQPPVPAPQPAQCGWPCVES